MTQGRLGRLAAGSTTRLPFALSVPAIALLAFLGLPAAVLLGRALVGEDLVGRLLTDPAIVAALEVSIATTAISLSLAVLLGTPLAYTLAIASFRGRRVVETIVDLPVVLPPSVAGLSLLLLFGRRGPLGGLLSDAGLEVAFTPLAVVLAQLFVAAPLYVRTVRIGFQAVDRGVIEAARVDGAAERAIFWQLMIPLALPAIASGAILAWLRALGEFGATIIFAGNIEGRTQTLPLLVYSALQTSLGASIATGAILAFVALAILLVVRSFIGRGEVSVPLAR